MNSPQSQGKTNSTIETRSAYAGESLYDLSQRLNNIHALQGKFQIAMESNDITESGKRVLLGSLRLLPQVETPGLENFQSDDPNRFDEEWERSTGRSTDPGGNGKSAGEHLQEIFASAGAKITQMASKIKDSLVDFYDARLNWYGNLVKEIDALMPKAANLHGSAFTNQQMLSVLQSAKAYRTYPTPLHRIKVVSGEAVKALMVAEAIKVSAATVAKAMAGDPKSLARAIDDLLKTIRTTATQEGDELHYRWDSFSTSVVATIPRAASYTNLTPTDFNVKSIRVVTSDTPAVQSTLNHATQDTLIQTRKYAVAAMQVVQSSMGKNNTDVWNAISSMRVAEDDESSDTARKINGVIALVTFADRIHEFIAKSAQQSYFDSVHSAVKWVDLSVKDMARIQSRQT